MKCEACGFRFDEVFRRPKILPCGHTLCLGCAQATKKCRVDDTVFPDADVLADNLFIIDVIVSSYASRFFCTTCQIPATQECIEDHETCNLQNFRQKEMAPKVDVVREVTALKQNIVSSLVEMLPAMSDSFNRLVEGATLRHCSGQEVLEQVEGALEAGAADGAWQRAAKALDEAARKSEEERPDVEQSLALLRCSAPCRLALELDVNGAKQRVDATVDLSEETSMSRSLRFMLYHLSTTGNLQVTPSDADEEGDVRPDGVGLGAIGDVKVQGRWFSRTAQDLPSTAQGPARPILRAARRVQQPAVDRENYELLMSLDEQDVVVTVEPFKCPVCLEQYQAGDGIILKGCLHMFCRDCLANTVQHTEMAEVRCPFQGDNYSCENVLSEREIKTLVPQHVFDQLMDRSVQLAESSMDNTFHCKTVDCRGWCEFQPGVNQFVCPVCFLKNCLQCQVIHDPEDCATYQDRIKRQAETDVEARQTLKKLEDMLKSGKAMHCPRCKVIITKNGGCAHMICAMCKTNFNWIGRR